jgi:serine/threonine protein kinase
VPSGDIGEGSVVGKYELRECIGRGGMGEVYRARVVRTGEPVAVKVMLPEAAKREVLRKRFFREARTAAALSHPHVVQIVEAFEHEGLPMLVMELLVGSSLEDRLRDTPKLDAVTVARLFGPVTSGVGTAHSMGVIHRDLKPDNVFITHEGAVKVLDFGIAKLTATGGLAGVTQALTKTGAILGTPYYMSPEQAFGEKTIDHRADVWSLGVMMYRCLTGVLPTRADSVGDVLRKVLAANFPSVAALAPETPPELASLVDRMVRARADERPADLREVYAVLSRVATQAAPSFGAAEGTLLRVDDPQGTEERGELARDDTSRGEPSRDDTSSDAATLYADGGAQGPAHLVASPLALTPGSLRLAPGARPSSARLSTTPTGTLALDGSAAERAREPSPGPASSQPIGGSGPTPELRARGRPTMVVPVVAILALVVVVALVLVLAR